MQNKGLETGIQTIEKEEIYDNTTDSTIKITESKAKLLYHEYMEMPTKTTIISNIGLVVAFITPLITSDFKGTWGIQSSVFRDIFIIASAISAYRLLESFFKYITKGRLLNEKNFIRELCGQEKETIVSKRQRQNAKIEAVRKAALIEGFKIGRKRRR